MRNLTRFLVSLAFLGFPAFADIAAFTAPTGLSFATFVPGGADCCNLGMVFTPNTNITVDALGLYDIPGEIAGVIGGVVALPASGDTVALYDSSGNLLAQAIVTPADAVVDSYYYQSITGVTLTAGATYTVDQFGTSGMWGFGAAPTTNASIAYDGHDYSFATSRTFPTSTAGAAGSAYYGPNIFFTPSMTSVPEPKGLPLLAAALLGLGAIVKRKLSRRISY
jgi:hypothetical protein